MKTGDKVKVYGYVEVISPSPKFTRCWPKGSHPYFSGNTGTLLVSDYMSEEGDFSEYQVTMDKDDIGFKGKKYPSFCSQAIVTCHRKQLRKIK